MFSGRTRQFRLDAPLVCREGSVAANTSLLLPPLITIFAVKAATAHGNWEAVGLMSVAAVAVATYPLTMEISNGTRWFLVFSAAVGAARFAGILAWGRIWAPELQTVERHKRFFATAFKGADGQSRLWDKYLWLAATPCRLATIGLVISARWIAPAAGYLVYEAATTLAFLGLRLKDPDRRLNKTMAAPRMSWLMIAAVLAGVWMVKIAETGKLDLGFHPAWFLVLAAGGSNAAQMERSLKFGEIAAAIPEFAGKSSLLKAQTYWASVFVAYASAVHALVFAVAGVAAGHHHNRGFAVAAVFAVTLIAGPASMICSRAANNRSDRLDIEGIRRLAPVVAVGLIWAAEQAGWAQLGIAHWVWFCLGAALIVVCSFWANLAARQ